MTICKVTGHLTEEGVTQGKVRAPDKHANDISDEEVKQGQVVTAHLRTLRSPGHGVLDVHRILAPPGGQAGDYMA